MATANRTSKLRAAQTRKIPTEVTYASGGGSLTVAAAEPADPARPDGEKQKPTLNMKAYSGGRMDLGWYGATYVDLKGMATPERLPILRQHDPAKVVGLSRSIEKAESVKDGGIKIAIDPHKTAHADEVMQLARDGFPWQASIGFKIHTDNEDDLEFLEDEDDEAEVNGETVKGPCMIARRSTLKEASVVPLGADSDTNVTASMDFTPKTKTTTTQNAKRSTTTMEKVPATKGELLAEFPGDEDREFRLDQREAEASLDEAKIAYSDILKQRLADAKAQAAAAKAAPAPAPVPAPRAPSLRQPIPIGASAPSGAPANAGPTPVELIVKYGLKADAGPAACAYWGAVNLYESQGQPRDLAQAAVAKNLGHLHKALMVEANGDKHWDHMPMQTALGEVRR